MEANKPALKNYADGWITERAGTEVPGFLKLAFAVIALSCVAYLLIFMNGEVDHPDRGALVRGFNDATSTSSTLSYVVAGLLAACGVIVVVFSLRKSHD